MARTRTVPALSALSNPAPAPRRVALVSCSAKKTPHRAPARELYASTLFRKSSAYAAATCDVWYVLSAKHGLVHPDQVLEPYDEKLTTAPPVVNGVAVPTPWAAAVSRGLLRELGLPGVAESTFVVLAGGVYTRNLETLPLRAEYPLSGMQIGERLSWLTRELQGVARW